MHILGTLDYSHIFVTITNIKLFVSVYKKKLFWVILVNFNVIRYMHIHFDFKYPSACMIKTD